MSMYVSATTYLDALFLLLGDNSNRSKNLVKEFIEITERNATRKEISTLDDELIDVYKHLIKTTLAENINQEDAISMKRLLLKVKSNESLNSYPVVRDILTDILSSQDSIKAEQIDQYLKSLQNALLLAEADEMNRKVFALTKKAADIKDPEDQAFELARIKTMFSDSLASMERKTTYADHNHSETYVDLSDEDSIRRAITVYRERSVVGVVKTGLQGLNRCLGARGGFGLGESFVFPASSHNFKSGMLILVMIWSIIYNTFKPSSGKRPLVYFVSLENEVNKNLIAMFKILYGQVERKHVVIGDWSDDQIVVWLRNYFSQFNTALIIDRYVPHEFSFGKFLQRYNALSELYEMVVFDLDYMSEARGVDPGDTVSTQGQIQMIKETYLKFVNHAKQSGYLLVTGHQLIKKAAEMTATFGQAVKKFHDGLMADSSDVFRIVDGVIYLNIEKNLEGEKFLAMQLRKNRGNEDTKEPDKYCAYRFTEFGIEDDLNGPPQYVTDIDAWVPEHHPQQETVVVEAMF